jgi:signal transduction histidine kinase
VQQRRIDTHCGAILVVPVQYQDRLLGTLTAVNHPNQPDFTEADVDLMVTMANQTAVAIQNAQTEAQRTQLLYDVVAANRELNDFAYVVSHDLKAPLRAIGSLANWLATDYADKLGPEGQQQLDLLMGRVKRMNALIDGILYYSRVGRLREEKKAVSFAETIADAIIMLAPPSHIHIQVETELPVVIGEPTRLQQVWQNLIGNALKFMDKPQGEIKIGCLDKGGEWQFYVADNGPGIEARHFAKIFQLFQTLTPRDRQENTGVGLTIVQKIVELHGGKIWLESQVGVGSTFWFTLPK